MGKHDLVRWMILIIALVTLVSCHTAMAQTSDPPSPDTLVLTDQQGEYPLGLYFDILEDPSGELTIEDVISQEYASQFVRSQETVPIYGYTDSAFWLRLRLRNDDLFTNPWLLETNFPNLNYVDLYMPVEAGGFIKKESGGLRPFETRDLPFTHVVFEAPLAPNVEQSLYLRVESGSSMTLAFTLWAPEAFALVKSNMLLRAGLFYGALLMILGYHLFLLFSLKEVSYLYMVLFLAGAILFFGTYEGLTDQYLWPGLASQKRYLLAFTMAMFFIAALKFSDIFLEQKTRSLVLHRVHYLFIGYWGLMILITPFVSFGFMAQSTSVGLLLTPILAVVSGFYHWRMGFLPARFYLVSWIGFMLGIATAELVRLGALPSTPFTERSYQIGLIWLALLWSLALADRINLLKTQAEEANRALGKSERRLSQILEGLPLGVVVYENNQNPSYINKRTSEILSNPLRDIQPGTSAGRTVAQSIDYFSFRVFGTDQPYPIENLPVMRALQGNLATADDVEADLVDRHVALEIWANPIKDDSGAIENVVVAFQDITQRKKAEAELDDYRHHLEQMVAKRTAEISSINEQLNKEIMVRQLLEEMLHKRIEWLSAVNRIHQTISGPTDLVEAFGQLSAKIIQLLDVRSVFIGLWDGQSEQIEAVYRNQATGPLRTISFSSRHLKSDPSLYDDFDQGKLVFLSPDQAQAFPDLTGELAHTGDQSLLLLAPMKSRQVFTGLLGLGMPPRQYENISDEEAVLIERIAFDLADLVEDSRLLEKAQALAANEERNRLARDLHDSVTQVLFSASLVAEVLPQILRRDPDLAQQSLEELRRLTRGALAEMRTMLLELRPLSVVKTPLGELLAQLTEAITSRTGLPFVFFIENTPPLPEDVHTGFYRIAQEGLNNVVKHAKASLVTVSLSATPDDRETGETWRGEIKLKIKDNGRGFSVNDGIIEHMGFGIIHERAASINATVDIKSQPGDGTELTLVWHN